MKVVFDSTVKIAGIGLVPWTRLGLEKWLPNYKIASLFDWDVQRKHPELCALEKNVPSLPSMAKLRTQDLLEQPAFQNMIHGALPGYSFITYKPVHIPDQLQGTRFISNQVDVSDRYENKAWFRRNSSDDVPMPSYQIRTLADLARQSDGFESLCNKLGAEALVLQDSALSGGKGTLRVHNARSYSEALQSLETKSIDGEIVVSKLLEAPRERSLQVCISSHGTFIGPLQIQIVADKRLCNPEVLTGDQFCGAVITTDCQDTAVSTKAHEYASVIAAKMQSEGYRGIFGIDMLLDVHDDLYVIEVNPRVTGVTPLLTALAQPDRQIPFYLMHVLELGGVPYMITDTKPESFESGSMIILHNRDSVPVRLGELKSGAYKTTSTLARMGDAIYYDELGPGECLVQRQVNERYVKPGERLITVYFKGSILDKNEQLIDNIKEFIEALYLRVEQINVESTAKDKV